MRWWHPLRDVTTEYKTDIHILYRPLSHSCSTGSLSPVASLAHRESRGKKVPRIEHLNNAFLLSSLFLSTIANPKQTLKNIVFASFCDLHEVVASKTEIMTGNVALATRTKLSVELTKERAHYPAYKITQQNKLSFNYRTLILLIHLTDTPPMPTQENH